MVDSPPHPIAVQHSPDVPLQILAGPGSGKTRVLTSRIAHLILHPSSLLPPQNICAVTFTNKAANELKERLERLIGKELAAKVKMGTFHSLCAGFLRRLGAQVGLESNFTVCDAEERCDSHDRLLHAPDLFFFSLAKRSSQNCWNLLSLHLKVPIFLLRKGRFFHSSPRRKQKANPPTIFFFLLPGHQPIPC